MTALSSHTVVPDRVSVDVPAGATVVVMSDLHLRSSATALSTQVERALATRLDALRSPAVLVLAGDIIELLGEPGLQPKAAFDAHPQLVKAIERISASEGCVVVALIGNHDGELAWNDGAAEQVRTALGAELAIEADLVFETAHGTDRIRVEHGNRFDPYNCFTDVREPLDTPLGHHIVREALPLLTRVGSGWLDGTTDLADPIDFPSFVGSRLAYRRLAGHLSWLLIPLFLLLFLIPTPVFLLTGHLPEDVQDWLRRSALLGVVFLVDVLVVVVVIAVLLRRSWQALRTLDLGERGYGQNAPARFSAAALVDRGHLGLVCGHSHRPELTEVTGTDGRRGFYANTGSGTPVVEAVPARLGMPPVYLRHLQISWLEIDPTPSLCLRLVVAEIPMAGASRLERMLARDLWSTTAEPSIVATWPGEPWPPNAVRLRD
jgi:UDP-2,3-diacylglucosamine pyrophosphatase LpxH